MEKCHIILQNYRIPCVFSFQHLFQPSRFDLLRTTMPLSSLFSVRWHFIRLFTHQKPCMSDEMSHVNPSENGTLETAHPASSPLNGLTVLDLTGSVSPHPSCRLHCHTVNTTANWTKPARREAHAGIKQEARRSKCYLPLKKNSLCVSHGHNRAC